ncbi:hypothetical protein ABID21_003460 [Pseudorhizobium tarimense]|uniref:Uncharacterized protein n=1 Tax=Pseudorhizobium tarimense TaxID=1079109 RepID=A0ABV2H9W7_9HYPH
MFQARAISSCCQRGGQAAAQCPLFVRYWLIFTPPLSDNAQASARAKGAERFDGFLQSLGKRLATGDRLLKELSRDIDGSVEAAPDGNGRTTHRE